MFHVKTICLENSGLNEIKQVFNVQYFLVFDMLRYFVTIQWKTWHIEFLTLFNYRVLFMPLYSVEPTWKRAILDIKHLWEIRGFESSDIFFPIQLEIAYIWSIKSLNYYTYLCSFCYPNFGNIWSDCLPFHLLELKNIFAKHP